MRLFLTKMTDEPSVYADEVELFRLTDGETGQLRKKLDPERDRRLRLAAEYENYRRHTKRESARTADKGKASF